MEADFSGWATKAGLLCTDGRTIMSGAFKHQDKLKVPLVWQHGHTNPENVLGHAILESRDEGVWTEGFFNKSAKAEHARELLEHGDINQMSIWANNLVEHGNKVFQGAIREVSLVLAGANPGALIENVTLRHGDLDEVLDDEVIIYTGLPIEHAAGDSPTDSVQDVFDSMTEIQQNVVAFLVAEAAAGVGALAQSTEGLVAHALADGDPSFKEIYENMSDPEKTFVHYLVGETSEKSSKTMVAHSDTGTDDGAGTEDGAGDASDTETDTEDGAGTDAAAGDGTVGDEGTGTGTDDGAGTEGTEGTESGTDDGTDTTNSDESKGTEMKHNVFEQDKDAVTGSALSHADIEGIVADATKNGSLKDAVENYALAHAIQDIDVLFPEARTLADSPELFSRRTEWVAKVMGGVRKSPFARIKTVSADITVAEARAKGYITGSLKKDEFFRVSKRVTTPTTIYKKQKLDRDDMIDITDFDVVAWLKGEMRLMLDEELARAILLGDGRDPGDEDKISEDNIRPIATDHELYTTVVNVNIGDASSSHREVLDAIVRNRKHLRGSGLPTLFTTETIIAEWMLLRDTVGRNIYANLSEVAAVLRVESIVPVEVMEEDTTTLAILVNLSDYVVGADKGGNVSMFDDFDIDYNQYKYLIETRASGALVKLKSAMVVKATAAANVLVVPTPPTFDGSAVTIINTANVVYRNADTDAVIDAAGSPYAVAEDATMNVVAEPAAGYYFSDSEVDDWSFTNLG